MNEHIISQKTYITVWAALLVLLGVTIFVAYVHLGAFNAIAALSIAVVKAVIIILYFMHVRYSPRLVWIFVGAGFFWLLILFALTFGDYLTRGYLPAPNVWRQ